MSQTAHSTTSPINNDEEVEHVEDDNNEEVYDEDEIEEVERYYANEEEEDEDGDIDGKQGPEVEVIYGGHEDEGEVEEEDQVEQDEPVEELPDANQPSEVLMRYACLICKKSAIFTYKYPSLHNSATGVYICCWCSHELKERKRLQLEEEKRMAAGEEGERVYQQRDNAPKRKRKLAKERGLWDFLLSSDISSWPLASKDIEGYALYRLQTLKGNPVKPKPAAYRNHCHAYCRCPYNEVQRNQPSSDSETDSVTDDEYSDYPPCYICYSEIGTALGYYKHLSAESNCGYLYCVTCKKFLCHEHSLYYNHDHPDTWIVTYEDSFEFRGGRIPKYGECWNHSDPYSYIDMSILRQTCHVCADKSPNNDYIYWMKAGKVIRDRLATALTTAICKRAPPSGETAQSLTTKSGMSSLSPYSPRSSSPPSSTAKGENSKSMQRVSIAQSPRSIPELINLFMQVEIPLFDFLHVLSEVDDIIRGILPVIKVEREKQIESKALGERIHVKIEKYKTPLDEHVDGCRRLWGEVSNGLINRVEVYAKSRFGIARSLEHCLESLNVSSLFMSSDSIESEQEEKATNVSDRTRGRQTGSLSRIDTNRKPKKEAYKNPESAPNERKAVNKDDILNVLNQVPITKERVSEELMYLSTIECLRETIEYGDPLFFTLTKEKVEDVAANLTPPLLKLKEQMLALKKKGTLDVSFVDNVKRVITKHSTLLKKAGKIEYWITK